MGTEGCALTESEEETGSGTSGPEWATTVVKGEGAAGLVARAEAE